MSGVKASPEDDDADDNITNIPMVLPHERVFPIQIGSDLFKLSGASISSDGRPFFFCFLLFCYTVLIFAKNSIFHGPI